jgi:hypothetical protein
MMTFFIDAAWRRQLPHIALLYPIWGNAASATHPFHRALFETYQFDTKYYAITNDPAKADMVLMPYSYNVAHTWAPDMIGLCKEMAHSTGLPLLIDGSGDIEQPIDIPNVIVLRYGGSRSEKKNNEITIPLFADDLLEHYAGGELRLLEKKLQPTVGFAGWASLSSLQTLRARIKDFVTHTEKGIFVRQKALRALERSKDVHTNFIIRPSYSAHTDTAQKSTELLRKEFVDNLLSSDYALDVRGDANNSIRLFEILSLGRIPLIVDTNRNFPFSDRLDYASFSCIVDVRDIEKLSEKLVDFHTTLTPERYVEMQRNARAAYREWFRVDALTPHLMDAIQEKLATLNDTE